MASVPTASPKKEFKWRPSRKYVVLIAVAAWPLIVFLQWDRQLLGDFELRVYASLLFYFCLAFKLRCGWIPFGVITGAVLGLGSDPALKGGTHESMMWETVNHLAGGTAIGLLIGLVLDSIPRIRQIPQSHMK